MRYQNLSPELVEKVKACSSADELATLAAAEGVEIDDEDLERFSGGAPWDDNTMPCKYCRSTDTRYLEVDRNGNSVFSCNSCGRRWTV